MTPTLLEQSRRAAEMLHRAANGGDSTMGQCKTTMRDVRDLLRAATRDDESPAGAESELQAACVRRYLEREMT